MSSAYFVRLARALFARGWNPIAPDMPGFGESDDADASGPESHAAILAKWADALAIKNAVWVGHSIGCNTVAHLARLRPDFVRAAVHIGPLWTRARYPQLRFVPRLPLDALREPLSIYRFVLPAYWRVGIWRWWCTWRRFVADMSARPPEALMIAGERDPLPDKSCTTSMRVPGAHACHFSDPDAVAELITRERGSPR
jgi:pimeloyl-ACP methyl ester carboxylesterase